MLTLGVSVPSTVATDTWSPGPGWTLVWADEFNGTSLDANKWGFDLGRTGYNNEPGWGNNELQSYTNTNASVQNGELVISAIKNPDSTYTSARVKTQGKYSWKYGKIAARMRLPYGQGIWPAFWMLGDNLTTVGWPKCGEIDIMEMIGGGENRDDTVHGALHWDADNATASYGTVQAGTPGRLPDPQFFHDDYHVFEIEWSSTEIIWKLDAVQFFRTSIDPGLWPTMDEFHRPFFLVLNLAVGGNWPGNPDASTIFPQTMRVDWVRVYKPDAAAARHSADTDGDRRIGLIELTRVIELYNTRFGTERTGRYKLQDGTEDGFAPDPLSTVNQTLARYHSADSKRDGYIDLFELTRVIELYNYRTGTVRTGQYHAQTDTEDGFAPGP